MNEEVKEVLPSARLKELGIALPEVAAPVASYIPALLSSGLVFTSGQLPFVDGKLSVSGKVGSQVSVEDAAAAARLAVLNALAAAASVVGGIDGIQRIVKLTVFVASSPDFTAQAQVANGASDVLIDIFGARGKHVRSAVGMAVLPLDTPVELELVVEANAASF